jgi:hypothetical protein
MNHIGIFSYSVFIRFREMEFTRDILQNLLVMGKLR